MRLLATDPAPEAEPYISAGGEKNGNGSPTAAIELPGNHGQVFNLRDRVINWRSFLFTLRDAGGQYRRSGHDRRPGPGIA